MAATRNKDRVIDSGSPDNRVIVVAVIVSLEV